MQLAVRCDDALLGKLLNGTLLAIDDLVLRSVEHFEVVLLKRWSLGSKGVRRVEWRKDLPLHWITDPGPSLLSPEVVRFAVGLLVEEKIFIARKPELKATVVPELLIERITLLWPIFEGILLNVVVLKSSKCVQSVLEDLLVLCLLTLVLFFPCEWLLFHGQTKVGCSDEVGDGGSFLSCFLDDLNAGRSSTNDTHTLALHIHTRVWPE